MGTDAAVREEYEAVVRGDRRDGARGRIAFCTSTADLDSGRGDLYVALGLATALAADGWGVSLWPLERWGESGPDADIAIVMIESHIPGLIPTGVRTVAWVRNHADRWAGLPYLERFDAVWCSSSDSAELMRGVTTRPVAVVPLAADPRLFRDGVASREASAVLTANFWGVARGVFDEVAQTPGRSFVWYGENHGGWLDVPPHLDPRGLVDYFDMGEVYARHRYVIDDLIAPAAAFGNQNSRLFEALAAGALVVTNDARGLAELGLGDVPVYARGGLGALLDELDADPTGVAALAERLRGVVLDRHTWTHRAAEVGALLETILATAAVGRDDPVLALAAAESVLHRDFEARYWAAHREIERLRAETGSLRHDIDAILGSTSWRITRPLRAVRRPRASE